MNQQEINDRNEQLIYDLLESQKDYSILELSFRITNCEQNGTKAVEIYDDNIYLLFGNGEFDSESEILEFFKEYENIKDYKELGVYEAKVLLDKNCDSDGQHSWYWEEVIHVLITNFWSIEETNQIEIDKEIVDSIPNFTTDDELPF